jgi:5-methylcytosine-specific restriction enzyme subunit McrC
MEQVFENFVSGFIRQHFPAIQSRIQSTSYLATVQGENVFQMRNDIWLPETSVVIDIKYKILDNEPENIKSSILQSDLYQMLAYAVRRKATHVHLIYPG